MKLFACIVFFATWFIGHNATAQEVIVKLEENYDTPNYAMWERGTEYVKRSVEDGMYISKGKDLPPVLKFSNRLSQLNCNYVSDMDFTIVRLKGDRKAFIGLSLKPTSWQDDNGKGKKILNSNTLSFQYNEEGQWKLFQDGNTVRSGTTTVVPERNQILVKHRKGLIEFYFNSKMIVDWEGSEAMEVNWYDTEIYGVEKKFQIALDKAVFTGYFDEKNEPLGEYILERYSSVSSASPITGQKLFRISAGNGKYQLMDDRGRIFPEQYEYISKTALGSLILVGKSDHSLYGYADLKGNLVYPIELKDAKDSPCGSLDADCPTNHYKVKDQSGKEFVITPTGNRVDK